MKILTVVAFFLLALFSNQFTFAQATQRHSVPMPDSSADMESISDSAIAAFTDSAQAAYKDSITLSDSLETMAKAAFADSVNLHWKGWKKFEIKPGYNYTLNSKHVLKGKSKSKLQYNIADFYLYLNGQLVKPPKTGYAFFAAGCLCFKYNDTLLLNSGLGFKVGVGVGIKIIDGRFTGTLHANTHNMEVYKRNKEDSVYLKSIIAVPVTQTMKLLNKPDYSPNEVIIGEYNATYQKFYQKNEDDQDEVKRYTVRIIFRCQVTGGTESIRSISSSGSK